MNILIIYASIHHKNTEKIAEILGSELKAKVLPFFKVKQEHLKEADLIGFGSGIYYAKFHRGLISLVDRTENEESKLCFLFSTAGMKRNVFLNRGHSNFKKLLNSKNYIVLDEFECLGWDTNGILEKFGGLNKGKPNQKDFENAKIFAQKLLKNSRINPH